MHLDGKLIGDKWAAVNETKNRFRFKNVVFYYEIKRNGAPC